MGPAPGDTRRGCRSHEAFAATGGVVRPRGMRPAASRDAGA